MAMLAKQNTFAAIQLSTYNKEDPNAPPGSWSCWINEHGVYGPQMLTMFCLNCGEYVWLSYKEQPIYHRYCDASPSEPSICQCYKKIETIPGSGARL